MGALSTRRAILPALALVALGLQLLSGCAQGSTSALAPTPVLTFQVSLLIQLSTDEARWFKDVEVPKGTNGYGLTELATEGDLEAKWYAEYRTHFVEAILGVKSQDPNYWLIYQWNDSQAKWEPLPVGADLFSLKDGHVLAWAYVDTSKKPAPVPSFTP